MCVDGESGIFVASLGARIYSEHIPAVVGSAWRFFDVKSTPIFRLLPRKKQQQGGGPPVMLAYTNPKKLVP